jgi:hypothetical protein
MSEDKDISRRDFLIKLGAGSAAAGVGLLSGTGVGRLVKALETPESSKIEPLTLTPEIIDGVEVYGLKEKITSANDVTGFYSYLNNRFAKANNIQIVDTIKQQKELLNPKERYLEITVRRSAYDSFVQKQTETGINFPEWVKMHVDVMNRCLKKAIPPVELKAVLRRILVVEDDMTKDFWDEKSYRQGKQGAPALDWAWLERFGSPVCIDTDESWAIADDYRNSGSNNFWEVRHENGKTIIGVPPGKASFDQFYEFPEENDSLSGKNKVSFDMGLIHEWCHYLLNLPDEYAQDVHDKSQRFQDFTFGTGSFMWPYVSPYLSYLLRENIKLNARSAFGPDDRRFSCFNDHSDSVEVAVQYQEPGAIGEVRRVRLVDNWIAGNKKVPEKADEVSANGTIKFGKDLFADNSNCWLIRAVAGNTREVFLPAAAFNMSKIAGLESAKYSLIFSGYDDLSRTYQEVKLVQDADVDEYIKNSQDPYYAKMKVEGTNTWFVWFLRA